jgi:triphosphoribosyl-dephospho-CoA synthase
MKPQLSLGQCATLACLLEAAAPKPGNVHRGADFEDVTFIDFAASAVLIGPALERAAVSGRLGSVVLCGVEAARQAARTNTYLGAVLLLAPLVLASQEQGLDPAALRAGVVRVLRSLDAHDAALVYQAICLAGAGGLGKVGEADVAGPPPHDLLHAMRLAEGRDLVARQYARGFVDLFDCVVPWLQSALERGWPIADAIAHVHVQLMHAHPDSLIARKCGRQVAEQAAALAGRVLAQGAPQDDGYQQALCDLDFWLRSDGHRRNPGTTADMLAAGLFVLLRSGRLVPPFAFYAPV